MLICPHCEQPLTRQPGVYRCPSGHSFDIAREGYVNLLPRPHPGDTRPMLQARRAFLDAGHYRPLAQELCVQAAFHLAARAPQRPLSLLDAGCGEGYYTGAVCACLRQRLPVPTPTPTPALTCYGLDASRDAARLAARSHRDLTFVVGNIKARLPFATASLDLLLNVFAPRHPAEFARVLAPGAALLVVIPTQHHLAEARAAFHLLNVEPEKEQHVCDQLAAHFALATARTLDYPLTLTGDDLSNLIAMSPSAHHATAATYERARQHTTFTTRASFRLLAFLRR